MNDRPDYPLTPEFLERCLPRPLRKQSFFERFVDVITTAEVLCAVVVISAMTCMVLMCVALVVVVSS